MASYQLKLEARNEGLSYREGVDVYRFNVKREGKRWLVSIPPTKEPLLRPAELAAPDAEAIYSRIEQFLSRVWWFGIWPVRYTVAFVAGAEPNPTFRRPAARPLN